MFDTSKCPPGLPLLLPAGPLNFCCPSAFAFDEPSQKFLHGLPPAAACVYICAVTCQLSKLLRATCFASPRAQAASCLPYSICAQQRPLRPCGQPWACWGVDQVSGVSYFSKSFLSLHLSSQSSGELSIGRPRLAPPSMLCTVASTESYQLDRLSTASSSCCCWCLRSQLAGQLTKVQACFSDDHAFASVVIFIRTTHQNL